MQLDVKRKFLVRSDRVKAIDFHDAEPWIISSLYNGRVIIWNFLTQVMVKTFSITDIPIRACRFIEQKNWFVCGADDFQVRVFNYNTGEKIVSFEAHPDYIRAIVVHPKQPFILTCSDDMTIKCWNWEENFKLVQAYESHNHFVMALAINPKDTNTFASACLDRTIKVWSFGSNTPNYNLEAHEKGVNFVDYYYGGDRPYLISSGDDNLVKIWDYQNRTCVQTLEGHSNNVSFAIFHPELPVIVSGSEDGTIKIWNSSTFKLEETLKYGLERAWAITYRRGLNLIAMGFDEGSVVLSLGNDEPRVDMDSTGRIVWAKNFYIQQAAVDLKQGPIQDGVHLRVELKDIMTCEDFPSEITYSPNGRFVTIIGDGEYTIYTSLAWRNKAFGSALDFVWSNDSNEYAIREASKNLSTIRIFRQFKERPNLMDVTYPVDKIFGGQLLALRGREWVCFYFWDDGRLVQTVDVYPEKIIWSSNGEMLAIICNESFFLLHFNPFNDGAQNGGSPVEPFTVISEIPECVQSGFWVGDCFIYTNTSHKLNFVVGGVVNSLSHFDQPYFTLGYLAKDERIYLISNSLEIISYALDLSVIEYQTLILRGDLEQASKILDKIPENSRGKIAHFLEQQGYKDLALEVTTDPDYKFDLALSMGCLEIAYEIAKDSKKEGKWKTLGDAALKAWDLKLALTCFESINDFGSLFLLLSSLGKRKELEKLAENCGESGLPNYAFIIQYMLSNIDECSNILKDEQRYPEAAFLGATYGLSSGSEVVSQWKSYLENCGRAFLGERLVLPAKFTDEKPLSENYEY